jgi:5-methylcytosine-specific restriction protein A
MSEPSAARNYRSAEAVAWRRLYSTSRWRALRAEQLRIMPICEMDHGFAVVAATVANHRIPHKGDEVLFFDPGNLQSVCKPHHDGVIQRTERAGFSPAVDASGYPTDPNHPANRRA